MTSYNCPLYKLHTPMYPVIVIKISVIPIITNYKAKLRIIINTLFSYYRVPRVGTHTFMWIRIYLILQQ